MAVRTGPEETAKNISGYLVAALEELKTKSSGKLMEERYKRFRRIGSFMEEAG